MPLNLAWPDVFSQLNSGSKSLEGISQKWYHVLTASYRFVYILIHFICGIGNFDHCIRWCLPDFSTKKLLFSLQLNIWGEKVITAKLCKYPIPNQTSNTFTHVHTYIRISKKGNTYVQKANYPMPAWSGLPSLNLSGKKIKKQKTTPLISHLPPSMNHK